MYSRTIDDRSLPRLADAPSAVPASDLRVGDLVSLEHRTEPMTVLDLTHISHRGFFECVRLTVGDRSDRHTFFLSEDRPVARIEVAS